MGKLLPCDYEDPSLTAKTHIKNASVVVHACNHTCNPNAGEWRLQTPMACRPASLLKQ